MGFFDIIKEVTKTVANESNKELAKNASKQMLELGKNAAKNIDTKQVTKVAGDLLTSFLKSRK